MKTLPVLLSLLLTASAGTAQSPEPVVSSPALSPQSTPTTTLKTLDDVIPLTMSSMRGHQMLYNEGYFVISSSRRSLEYARQHMFESSAEALTRALGEIRKDSSGYASSMKKDVSEAASGGVAIVSHGTKKTGEMLSGTHTLAKKELAYARQSFGRSMDAFVTGVVGIAERTEDERRELADIPGAYYRNLKDDFSNIFELTQQARQKISGGIEIGWDKAFARASDEFRSEYERSGDSHNTLEALGPVLFGWLKAFYQGIAAPTAKTVVKATTTGSSLAFLPVASSVVVAGRTVQAVGLTVFYTGKTGVKIIAPTIEGGLLASMSLASAASVPITYAGGAALGAVNQVAFTAAGPAYTTVSGAARTVKDTAGYVAFVTFDAASAATKVAINQASSGIVLGYNALTAIPAHLLIGAGDAAIFLAWDGPRLVLAQARGEVGPAGSSARISDLPVGSVVDLKKLKAADGVKVDVLTTDETAIKDVIERLPNDLREAAHAPAKND